MGIDDARAGGFCFALLLEPLSVSDFPVGRESCDKGDSDVRELSKREGKKKARGENPCRSKKKRKSEFFRALFHTSNSERKKKNQECSTSFPLLRHGSRRPCRRGPCSRAPPQEVPSSPDHPCVQSGPRPHRGRAPSPQEVAAAGATAALVEAAAAQVRRLLPMAAACSALLPRSAPTMRDDSSSRTAPEVGLVWAGVCVCVCGARASDWRMAKRRKKVDW